VEPQPCAPLLTAPQHEKQRGKALFFVRTTSKLVTEKTVEQARRSAARRAGARL